MVKMADALQYLSTHSCHSPGLHISKLEYRLDHEASFCHWNMRGSDVCHLWNDAV